jgi:ribonuclease D
MAGDELIAEVLEGPDPEAAWRTLDVAHKLSEVEQRRLSAMLRWRERVAEEKNQPTNSVIGLGAAIELARRCPTSLADMARNRRISSGFVRNYGEALVELLKDPPGPFPPSPPDPRERLFARLLQLWAEGMEGEGKIAASLLMPDGLRFRLAQGQALFGWREQAVGEKYAKLRSGDLRISWGGDGLCIGDDGDRKNIFRW